jgi:hypothetical protein
MSHWCVRGGATAGRAVWLAIALCLIPFIVPARAGDVIPVNVDGARLIQLPAGAKTVIIGNPLIADLSIQPGGLAVITGKGYGATNVIVLDKDGAVLSEESVLVRGPKDPTVIVYRGVARNTYSCTPECEPRITLGDDRDYFAQTIAESVTRTNQAMAAGSK